jgi:hypothetical protein
MWHLLAVGARSQNVDGRRPQEKRKKKKILGMSIAAPCSSSPSFRSRRFAGLVHDASSNLFITFPSQKKFFKPLDICIYSALFHICRRKRHPARKVGIMFLFTFILQKKANYCRI